MSLFVILFHMFCTANVLVRWGGTVVYTLTNVYPNRDGWWRFHWSNGRNNINGTSAHMRSIRHMYAWADMGLPGAQETKHYVLKFMREIVGILEQEFPGALVQDFNEFKAIPEWHINVERDVLQDFGISRRRKMFSIVRPDFGDVAPIRKKYVWQPHGFEAWKFIRASGSRDLASSS